MQKKIMVMVMMMVMMIEIGGENHTIKKKKKRETLLFSEEGEDKIRNRCLLLFLGYFFPSFFFSQKMSKKIRGQTRDSAFFSTVLSRIYLKFKAK